MSNPLLPLVDAFLTDLLNSGKAETTIASYRSTLHKLARFYQGPVAGLTPAVLRRFLATINGGNPNNRARYFSNIKIFLNWCYRFEYISTNPILKLETPRWHEYPPRSIPPAHLELLAREIEAAPPPYRLLFTLLLETGMRVREALGILVRDIDLAPGAETIVIRGKGDRVRAVPLVPGLRSLELLREHLDRAAPGQTFLFPSPAGPGAPLTYEEARAFWRAMQKKTGTAYRIHQLRHSCATHLLNNGVSLDAIQKLLGHKKLSTTCRYAQLEHGVLRRAIAGHLRRQKEENAGVPRS